MSKKMWSFKTKNFTVMWEIEPDTLYTKYMDADLAAECLEKVRSGEWKCFMSTVRVVENKSKVELATEYLGNSIYGNPADFRDHFGMKQKGHGSYFSDMVRTAVREARKAFPVVQAAVKQEVQAKNRLLAVKLRSR